MNPDEMARWQSAIYDLLMERVGIPYGITIDGAGSDSDELDFTLSEIKQALNALEDRLIDAKAAQSR
jgi:hypothetical protein